MPRLQETTTRLSSNLPFREAATEVTYSHQTSVSEATCRRYTYRHGQAAEAVAQQASSPLPEGSLIEPPEKMMFSVDGSFLHLINGEWREVKSIAIGEFRDKDERGRPVHMNVALRHKKDVVGERREKVVPNRANRGQL